MLELYGGRARIAFWALGLSALIVVLVAFLQVSIGPGKSDANGIISPWDFTQAPPDGMSKGDVRVVASGNSNQSAESKNYKPYVQARAIR